VTAFKILPEAEIEAADAALRYDDQRQGLGDEFLTELSRVYQSIRVSPNTGAPSESYGGPHKVRRSLLSRFPYIVIFLCRPEEIVIFLCRPEETVILAVSHVRRRPMYWLNRLA
jgi:hypothetical protein